MGDEVGMFATRRNHSDGFRSQRSMALARDAMVCSSQPLASAAGLEILRRGGNAIDAAIAAAAVLGVVEPFSTGIGGDCFMQIWNAREHKLFGLNGSGRAPAAATRDAVRAQTGDTMPVHGMLPVTIPGAMHAWCCALDRFGSLPLATVLEAAIHYAADGFPVSEIISHQWNLIVSSRVLRHPDALRTFTLDGRAPRLGEIFSNPTLARSLELLADGGCDAFYRGALAERIVAFARANGGLHTVDDFAAHTSEWVEPISTTYRGYTLCEIPPNGQGLTALIALNILEQFDLPSLPLGSADALHLRIEAIKLAFADRNRYIADPAQVSVPTAELLSKDYARVRAGLIESGRALPGVPPGVFPVGTDTVYLTTADRDGNVVSLINSLFFPFGSGMVAGDTGIVLQNRGYGFSLDPSHPNCVAPRKRPFHTIIPAMLLKDGRPLLSFGVMGGDVQAQGHVQVISNMVDHGCNIQEALDYPRVHYLDGCNVAVENDYAVEVRAELQGRGHNVQDEFATLLRGGFGGGQGIMIDPATGAYWGGSDRRKDGCAVGF
ncbi:MAG TPA: gamma-glutamyltransferase [Candidatus Kryptonia bacterium]|nr:gamma-glutamyltransferase [Candidatus Kryptonia bacterium]